MNEETYEAYMEQHGELIYRNVGVSMLPMLKQGRDLFVVRKKSPGRCKKYDVVLYRRPSGQYVLHRVVGVRKQDYVILGDNCMRKEYGITDEDIIGVLTAFVRKGKRYTTEDIRYRIYTRVWYCIYPIRKIAKRIRSKFI